VSDSLIDHPVNSLIVHTDLSRERVDLRLDGTAVVVGEVGRWFPVL
jgi:hypothetical protein